MRAAARARQRAGHLGLELEPADERYRISHIHRVGPADKEWLGLAVGDFVLAIDGQDIEAGDNYGRILNQALTNTSATIARAMTSGFCPAEARLRVRRA